VLQKIFKDFAAISLFTLRIIRVKIIRVYKCVIKSFRTVRLERELQMIQLSAIRCSCIAIL
jgi:hypothetical protein